VSKLANESKSLAEAPGALSLAALIGGRPVPELLLAPLTGKRLQVKILL
jgi:hypothetical protein